MALQFTVTVMRPMAADGVDIRVIRKDWADDPGLYCRIALEPMGRGTPRLDQIAERVGAAVAHCCEQLATANRADERLRAMLAEARYNARVLAHSYETGNNPPQHIVAESLNYPVKC